MADANGFTTGTINERMMMYFNAALGATWGVAAWDEVAWDGADGNHTNINEAAAAFGESNGITGPGSLFSQLGSFCCQRKIGSKGRSKSQEPLPLNGIATTGRTRGRI